MKIKPTRLENEKQIWTKPVINNINKNVILAKGSGNKDSPPQTATTRS